MYGLISKITAAAGQRDALANTRRRVLGVVLAALLVVPALAFAQAPIGVLGITQEVVFLEKRLQDTREVVVRGYVFRVGTLNGRRVVVGRSGAGKVNASIAATLLITQFNPTAVFFSGTAGAVDQELRPGDVVIGRTMAQHDVGAQTSDGLRRSGTRNVVTGELEPVLMPAPDALLTLARESAQSLRLPPVRTAAGDRVPRIVEGVIVTGDVFLTDAARREELRRSLGASAVEMEGAAVVQVCRQLKVPCLVVRSVTDTADSQAAASYREFLATASENAAALVAAIIARLGTAFP
jgi:adenosylhomocysteine nucleosidase